MQLSTPLDTRRRSAAIAVGVTALQPTARYMRQIRAGVGLQDWLSSDSSVGWSSDSDSTLAEGPVVGTYRWPLALYEDRLTTIPEDPLTDPPNDPLANWEERYPNAYREWQEVLRYSAGAAGVAGAAGAAYNYFAKEEKKDDSRDIYTGGGSSGSGGGGGRGGVGVPRSNNSALLVLAVLLVAARRNF